MWYLNVGTLLALIYGFLSVILFLVVVGFVIFEKVKTFINDEDFKVPKIIDLLDFMYFDCRDFNECLLFLFLIMFLSPLLIFILIIFFWLPVIIIGFVIGSLYYLRYLKRKNRL